MSPDPQDAGSLAAKRPAPRPEPTIAEAVAAYGWPPKNAPQSPRPELLAQSWGPSLAPDASRVAFVSDRSGAPRAYVASCAEAIDDAPLQLETGGEPVTEVDFSPDGEWIACVIAPGGSVRHEVWLIRPDGSELKLAAGAADGSAFLNGWAADSGRLVVTHAGRAANDRRVYLIDPNDGRAELVARGHSLMLLDVCPGEQAWLLRHGTRSACWLSIGRPSGPSLELLGAAAATEGGAGSSDLGYFAADGNTVYVRSDLGRERAVLIEITIADGSRRVVSERSDAELESLAISRDRSALVLLWNVGGGRSELSRFDLTNRVERALHACPGEVITGLSLAQDGRMLALCVESPTEPKRLCLIDSYDEVQTLPAFAQPRSIPAFAPAVLHRFHAADGVALSGWLYPSLGAPRAGGPMVIHLHGGPEAQERPVWNPLFNELRLRGIGVFAPNVRGSSGFGRAFVHADERERRFDAIADVRACIDYLVARELADAQRLGCMGRSYGGYLSLAALVRYPDAFAVGVDTCGMADLQTFYERTERWIADQAVSKYGHPERDRTLLRALSPLHDLAKLAAPLLVVHGAHDSNVPLYEAEQVVRELARHERAGGFLLFPDEGHEILQRANQARYIQVVCDWVAQYLLE